MNNDLAHDVIAALSGFALAVVGYLGISRKQQTEEKTAVVDHSIVADKETWQRMVELSAMHGQEIEKLQARLDEAERRDAEKDEQIKSIEANHKEEKIELSARIKTLESTVARMGVLLGEKDKTIEELHKMNARLRDGVWKAKTL